MLACIISFHTGDRAPEQVSLSQTSYDSVRNFSTPTKLRLVGNHLLVEFSGYSVGMKASFIDLVVASKSLPGRSGS